MGQVCRRVILKPDGLTPEQDSQLGELLSGALRLQNELAGRSAHILRLNGLTSDDRAYYLEHEPAKPMPVAPLFDPEQPGASPEELLKVAVALLDALKATHEFRQQGRASIHGGLCPGVILSGEGGITQITDFDVARCICTALGPESYLSLAAGPPATTEGIFEGATGVWQVLPPESTDHDDRLIAFIDPAKFAQARPTAFEPPSDIASAGFILHLLAEHLHPYFHDEPTIHRDMAMFQQMVMMVMPAAIRRKDLRELAKIDPAMKAWWELVPQMVSIVPDGRPSASAGLKQLMDVGLKPADATTIALGRFEEFVADAANRPLEDTAWWAAADERLRAFPGLPLEKAREADAIRKLAEAIDRLPTPDWEQSIQPLLQVLALAGVSEGLKTKVREVNTILRRNAGACDDLADINRKLAQAAAADATQRVELLETLGGRLAELLSGGPLLPSAESRVNAVRDELERQRARLEEELSHLRTDAETWLEQAHQAQGDREALRKLLARPPEAAKSLDDVRERVEQYASILEQLDATARQRDELRQSLTNQLAKARAMFKGTQFEEAREALGAIELQQEFPELAEQAATLRREIETRVSELQAQQRARAHFDELYGRSEKLAQTGTLEALAEAQRLLGEACGVLGPQDEPTRRAETLLKEVQAKKQRLIDAIAENKRKSKQSLDDAEDHLRHERFSKAEGLARPFAEIDDAEIHDRAAAILKAVQARREQVGPVLDKWLAEAEELVAARNYATAESRISQIAEHDLVTTTQRSAALALREEIRAARVKEEQERRLASERLAEARKAVTECRLERAAELLKQVADSPFAAGEDQASAAALSPDVARLRKAETLIKANEFAQARASLKTDFPAASAKEHPEAYPAAQALIEQSRKSELAALVDALQKHLDEGEKWESRNQGSLIGFSVNVSLRDTAEWVRDSLRPVDTFLQARAGAAANEPNQPGTRIGRKYEIVRTLGRGGMGTTYLANDLGLDRLVALKMVGPVDQVGGLAEALQREAQAICKLDFPKHILHVNNFDTIDGFCCFDTDYKEATDLSEHVRGRKLKPREVAEILIPIATALEYAHSQHVFHRDIKPQNILVSRSGQEGPWLIDFGLARISSMCHQHAAGGLCGTPGYIAPEVIKSLGEGSNDRAADIFSLGCVLYELLTGELPYQVAGTTGRGRRSSSTFSPTRLGMPTPDPTRAVPEGKSDSSPALGGSAANLAGSSAGTGRRGAARLLLNTIQAGQLTLPDNIPEGLREVCRQALDIDPAKRFDSAAGLANALRSFVEAEEQRAREARLTELKKRFQEAIGKARTRYEQRDQNTPAELAALDDAQAMVQAAVKAAPQGAADNSAETLLRSINETRQQIQQQTSEANQELGLAKVDAANRQWKQACKRAEFVLGVGYVPDLHADAQATLEEVQQGLSRQRSKLIKVGAVCVGVVGAIAAVGAWLLLVPPSTPTIAFAEAAGGQPVAVKIEGGSSLATIRYTLDGSDPTAASPAYDAKQGLNLDKPGKHVVKARAFKMGGAASGIATGERTIQAVLAGPIITPAEQGRRFDTQVMVTLKAADGAAIRFSRDQGKTWEEYHEPFPLTETTELQAVASMQGMQDSPATSATFTKMGMVAKPTITPAGTARTFDEKVTVTVTADAGATIRVSRDQGQTWQDYSGPFELTNSAEIRAMASMQGAKDSPVETATFTKLGVAAKPTITPEGEARTFKDKVTVTIQAGTGAAIRVSRDQGKTWQDYSGPFELTNSAEIRAVASMQGAKDSPIETATFNKMGVAAQPKITPEGTARTFDEKVTVTMSAEAGAKIRVSRDQGRTWQDYAGPFELTDSAEIQAIASLQGATDSPVATATFTKMGVAAQPKITPEGAARTFDEKVTVTVSAEAGAKIRVSRDQGKTWQDYTGPIELTNSAELQAIASMQGAKDSPIATATFTKLGMAAQPTITPEGTARTFKDKVTVTIQAEAGASIRVSRDKGQAWQDYAGPIELTNSAEIQAVASKTGSKDSPVATATFTRMGIAAAPTIAPEGTARTFTEKTTVTIKAADGATIRVSRDKGQTWQNYTGPFELTDSADIMAVAAMQGMQDSPPASATFVKKTEVVSTTNPFQTRRAQLETKLNSKSARPGDVVPLAPADVAKTLYEIALLKWGRPAATGQVPDFPQAAREFARELWHDNPDLRVVPTHFVDYFWGSTQLYACLYEADYSPNVLQLQGGDTISVTCIKVADLDAAFLQQVKSNPAAAAKAVLDPVMKQAAELGFFNRPPASGSFGLVISPDGPLLGAGLPGATFTQLTISNPVSVLLKKSPDPAYAKALPTSITQLEQLSGADYANHRTAVWNTVALRMAPPDLDTRDMMAKWKAQFAALAASSATPEPRESATPWSSAADTHQPNVSIKEE